jgi:probable F420-dependent oxidoreductase
VKVSLTLSGFTRLFDGDLRRVLDAARRADDAGIDQLVVADHVVMGPRIDRYPFGTFPYGPEEPWPDPLMLLAAIAAVTTRVRLATGILITPLRPVAVLAKQCATLDQQSGGRLDLGVGVGWQREEYEAVGVPFARRFAVLDDQLVALRALWSAEQPVEVHLETVDFGPTWCMPRPVQAGGVPIGFGMAATDATVSRIAEHGSAWLPIHTTSRDELRDGSARIRAALAEHGRDPSSLEIRYAARPVLNDDGALDHDATRAAAEDLAQDGVTIASFGLGRNLERPGAIDRFIADLAEAFRR